MTTQDIAIEQITKPGWRSKKLWAYLIAQATCAGLLVFTNLDPWVARILAGGIVFNATAYVGGVAWLDRAVALALAVHGEKNSEEQ